MDRVRRRLSPSLILGTAMLVLAGGGTAIAAGELITRGDQIAPGVIDGDHIKAHSLAKGDLQHPTLRLRVRRDGGLYGDPSDATATRDSLGVYVVTFNRGIGGPRNPRWLDHCAVVATPGPTAGFSGGTGQDVTLTTTRTATSAVVVHATKPDYELHHSVLRDASFDIAAIC